MDKPFVDDIEEVSDETLVAQAKRGDRAALESLAIRHQPWIYNIARRMLWLPDFAEDATQEVLIKMIGGLSAFRGESRFVFSSGTAAGTVGLLTGYDQILTFVNVPADIGASTYGHQSGHALFGGERLPHPHRRERSQRDGEHRARGPHRCCQQV